HNPLLANSGQANKSQDWPPHAGVGIGATGTHSTRAQHNFFGGRTMMTCEISAAVFGNLDGEVLVAELPADIPPGFRVVGRMAFRNGQCISRCGEQTMEAACIM